MQKQITNEVLSNVIITLSMLKRYNTINCSGHEGSDDSWTELDVDVNGELIMFEDLNKIIVDMKKYL